MIQAFDGKQPVIAESAFVSEMAYIIGDVEIGEGSSVWPGAVIRGDVGRIVIGRNTHIEDNAVLHAKPGITIGDNVIIGHCAVIHGKSIGDQTLIGNNATVLDRSVIGDHCVVAAGSVVSPDTVLQPGHLAVGVPARIRGALSDEHRARLESGPGSYSRLIKKYKDQKIK